MGGRPVHDQDFDIQRAQQSDIQENVAEVFARHDRAINADDEDFFAKTRDVLQNAAQVSEFHVLWVLSISAAITNLLPPADSMQFLRADCLRRFVQRFRFRLLLQLAPVKPCEISHFLLFWRSRSAIISGDVSEYKIHPFCWHRRDGHGGRGGGDARRRLGRNRLR